MSLSLPPTTYVHQPLLKDGPGSAPLPEQIEDLLQDRKLLVGRCQLRLKSLDAASLCGNTGGDRLQDLRKSDFRGYGVAVPRWKRWEPAGHGTYRTGTPKPP